jgi:beta-glucanase (GH16 family)
MTTAAACGSHSPIAPTLPSTGASTTAPSPAPTVPSWTLAFSDEFDTPGAPDSTRWGYELGYQRNQEAQYYTSRPDNVRVENGSLIIEARKEPYHGFQYTSASVRTLGKFNFTYGRVEVRAKVPAAVGTWAAIWTLGTTAPWPTGGEVDIMEHLGFDPPTIHGTIHTDAYNDGATTAVSDPSKSFHAYAMEWDADQIVLSVDGRSYFTYRNPGTGTAAWPFDAPQYLLLNLAIGGTWGGQQGIDDGAFPQEFLIDYVRVYQKH